jgi:pimeloyl-ACP methyl ester carboxylesterase
MKTNETPSKESPVRKHATAAMAVAILCLWGPPWQVRGENAAKGETMTKPAKDLPLTGEVFSVEGHTAFLIPATPTSASNATPWVWYAPTLPGLPAPEEKWMFERFQRAGLAIAGIDVGESYGNPEGRRLFTALHEELVSKRGMSKQPCLLMRSRGGLMLLNWASEHPSSVSCIAGVYPVCNIASYPGIAPAAPAYGMTAEQLTAKLSEHNPIERLEPLARARVPIFIIHGDSDAVVPLDRNSGEVAKRYRQFGGEVELKVIQGRGHDYWPGWFQCQELVDFVIRNARPAVAK